MKIHIVTVQILQLKKYFNNNLYGIILYFEIHYKILIKMGYFDILL